jgi:hypothetical protein
MEDETFTADFIGRPGDTRDLAAHSIVGQYGGKVIAGGTFLPDQLRDLEIKVAALYAKPLKEALQKAGLRIRLTPGA